MSENAPVRLEPGDTAPPLDLPDDAVPVDEVVRRPEPFVA